MGRADWTTGQSAVLVAEIAAPSEVSSCEGQCGPASDRCAGARHVASHQARAGAAAPIRIAMMRIDTRCTKFSIS
jgi:hypothetical protein